MKFHESSTITKHIAALDGLRGYSIIIVLLFHAGAPFLTGGYVGVDIFFVLSGYLITRSLITEFNFRQRVSLKKFYIRRALRLFPALIVMLAATTLIQTLHQPDNKDPITEALIALFYYSNWARAFQWYDMPMLGHTWSLSIEEQFYLTWPLVFIMLSRIRTINLLIPVTTITICGAISWRFYLQNEGLHPARIYNGLDTRADSILIGCLTAFLLTNSIFINIIYTKNGKNIIKILAILSVLTLAVLATSTHWDDAWTIKSGYLITESCAAIIIIIFLATHTNTTISILFSNKWITQVGILSYGIYLWHYPIYQSLHHNEFRGREVLIYGTTITFIVAFLSHKCIESPFLRYKKHFTD